MQTRLLHTGVITDRSIKGSTVNTAAESTDSIFRRSPAPPSTIMVKELYDASFELSDEQKAMATFWKDVPGATSPGHWLSILQQVIKQTGTTLEKAALAYALQALASTMH